MILVVKNGSWYFCGLNFNVTQFIDKRITEGVI